MFILFFFTLSLFFSSFIMYFIYIFFSYILNLFSANLKLVWFYSYLFLLLLFIFFMPSLILGSVPFVYILGRMGFTLFIFSFIFWYISYFGSFILTSRFHFNSVFVVILLFRFDSFVTLLRPVTLTLRVFINVSLGHFLIMILHLNLYYLVLLVWLIELFVYLVQSYVFITLSSSYLVILYLASSLNF